MTKILSRYATLGSLALLSMQAFATSTEAPIGINNYNHAGKQYPPVFFVTNIENEKFRRALEDKRAFSEIDDKAVGLPIGLRVLNGLRRKNDGVGFSSLMLSASTLGIIPIVSNKSFQVHYDIFVQGESVAQFQYEMNSTDIENMWGNLRNENELKDDEQIFMEITIDKFLTELKGVKEVQNIFEEYYYYFE